MMPRYTFLPVRAFAPLLGVVSLALLLAAPSAYAQNVPLTAINIRDKYPYVNLLAFPGCVLQDVDWDLVIGDYINSPDVNKFYFIATDAPPQVNQGRGGLDGTVYFACDTDLRTDPNLRNQDGTLKDEWVQLSPSAWEQVVIEILIGLITLGATLGAYAVGLTAKLLAPLVVFKSFITHGMVQTGWPFVQGFANLGFIFALLFIAFGTVLNLNFGISNKKLIPRLLIAAIFINFSLVIGGLIIDISRVIMSIFTFAITGNNLDQLGAGILEASTALQSVFDTTTGGFLRAKVHLLRWQTPFQLLLSTVLIWTLAAGLLVVAVGLFVRYIMLVLLLIISPIAFLGFAFPGMGGIATMWWKTFIRYVLYGPIALAVLILLTKVDGAKSIDVKNNFAASVATIVMMAALGFAAVTAGRKLGFIGANATVNFLKGAPRTAWKHPGTTGAVLAGIATGGVGGAVAGAVLGRLGVGGAKRAGYQARDFGRTIKDTTGTAIRKRVPGGKYIMGPRRDEKGNLKPGEDSLGARVGRFLGPYKSDQAKAAARGPRDNAMHGAYAVENLVLPDVRAVLDGDQIRMFAEAAAADPQNADLRQRVNIILSDANVVRTMDPENKARFMALDNHQDQLLRTLRAIAQQDASK